MKSRLKCLAMLVLSFAISGCADAPNAPVGASPESATPVVFNLAGAPTVEFSVPDMMCPESCAVKTKEILSQVPGAKDVVVDFETRTATVAIDEGKFDAQQAIAALVDHGFERSALKAGAAANVVAKPQAATQ